jgi:RNA polymerase sigma-70 factor (ECF subfamily)
MNGHEMQTQLLQLGNGAHALALQLLGNADDATDVVQDAIVKTLAPRGGYDSTAGPLAPWFLRVVRNGCIDLLRRRRPGGVDVAELSHPGPGPQAVAEASQRDRELHAALSRLPAGQRQVIVLRDYMDLSYAEIATVLNVPAGTVMSKLHRARTALRKELTNHE